MRSLAYSGTRIAQSSVQRSRLTLATTDPVQVTAARETSERDDAVVLALVRERYAPLIAALPVRADGARAHEMLEEIRGIRGLSRRANRRLLGRG